MKLSIILISAASTLALVGCGGGGGSGSAPTTTGPVASTLSFPVRSASNTLIANGESVTLRATGTSATEITDGSCTGTLTGTAGPANVVTTFEGSAALSATSVSTLSFTNCTPASSVDTSTDYYDTAYLPLGSSSTGSYTVYQTPPAIPNTVTVGTTGIIGTETYYTDNTKAVPDGRSDQSFVVEADTSTTAIINLITKRYNQSNQLLYTSQARIRISAAGTFTRVSEDVQYATTSTLRLVFR